MQTPIYHIGFLILDQHAGKGGLENVLASVANGLEQFNIKSTILIQKMPDDPQFLTRFSNIKIMPTLPRKYFLNYLPKAIQHQIQKYNYNQLNYKFLSNHQFDALIVLNISFNLYRSLPALQKIHKDNPQMPIIAWPHGTLKAIDPSILHKVLKKYQKKPIFSHFFAISKGIYEEISSIFDTDKIKLVYNPIPDADIAIKYSPRKLLYIGRIDSPGKRVKELLQVLANIKGDWHLDLIGDISKENYQILQDLIASLNLKNKITLHGWHDQPWSLVSQASLLILNSTSEGFPSVLIEAMKRGIPCLSSNCPTGPCEIIQHNKNGWLFEVDDTAQLTQLLQDHISGVLITPNQQQIVDSVKFFAEKNMLLNFKNEIISVIEEYRS